MSIRKIMAIFQNISKDMMKNKQIFLTFFMFPVMTILFYNMIPEQKEFFSTVFIPMHLIMVPVTLMSSIISEEKEKYTLRTLIMANVKPVEYLIGIGLFVLSSSIISSSLFLIVNNFIGQELLRFSIIVILSISCSMIIGAVIGIYTQNQMSANSFSTSLSMILGFIPIVSVFNDTIKQIASVLYTQRMHNVVSSINEPILGTDYLVMLVNFSICLIAFVLVYRKRKLDN